WKANRKVIFSPTCISRVSGDMSKVGGRLLPPKLVSGETEVKRSGLPKRSSRAAKSLLSDSKEIWASALSDSSVSNSKLSRKRPARQKDDLCIYNALSSIAMPVFYQILTTKNTKSTKINMFYYLRALRVLRV